VFEFLQINFSVCSRNYVDHRYYREHSNVVVEFWEIIIFNTDTFAGQAYNDDIANSSFISESRESQLLAIPLSSLRIVDECSTQDIADRLGGELRVTLVEGQLPTSATAKGKLIREEGRVQCECFYRLRKLPRGLKRDVVHLV
jgi:hypothetical protein